MKRMFLKTALIGLFIPLCVGTYGLYLKLTEGSMETMNLSIIDISSTREWQDTASIYINKRNDIISDIQDGKYSSRKWVGYLKNIECAPLLDGDIALIDYMLENPSKFTTKVENIKVESSNITQLTKDEVIMTAKISCREDNKSRTYDYEIAFKRIKGKWLISKYALL